MFLISGAIALVLLALVVGWLVPTRARLLVWTAIVIVGVVPWSGWVGHSHWARVQWVPFLPPLRVRDIVLNVIFYMPIGFFFVQRGSRPGSVTRAVLFAALLSLVTETTQVFSHGRFPAMTDVATNTIGAWIGALAARRLAG